MRVQTLIAAPCCAKPEDPAQVVTVTIYTVTAIPYELLMSKTGL